MFRERFKEDGDLFGNLDVEIPIALPSGEEPIKKPEVPKPRPQRQRARPGAGDEAVRGRFACIGRFARTGCFLCIGRFACIGRFTRIVHPVRLLPREQIIKQRTRLPALLRRLPQIQRLRVPSGQAPYPLPDRLSIGLSARHPQGRSPMRQSRNSSGIRHPTGRTVLPGPARLHPPRALPFPPLPLKKSRKRSPPLDPIKKADGG